MSHPDQNTIDLLLEKHALGTLTREESAVLEKWYAAFPAGSQAFEDASERHQTRESMKTDIFRAIQAEMPAASYQAVEPAVVAADHVPEKRPVRYMYWRAAAAILLLLATGGGIYLLKGRSVPPSYTEVTAPAGKNLFYLQLPDGSALWMEPGSKLRYDSHFGKTSRDVQIIDGLAHFAVAPGASHPFIVSTTAGIQAKVLGTEFSVKAYNGLPNVTIHVESGAVQVSDSTQVLGVLKAGQQIEYQLGTHTAIRNEGIEDNWRQGSLTLQNVTFAEVARILHNRYQVEVLYDSAIVSPYRFNLRIDSKTTLEEVMEMLKDLSGMTYTLSNGQVKITGVQQ
ncbi:ferric-dicitrate binding protein FerR (iron transport regulator) [Chitinophaga dinghuensis]|uniref:Ferric-dicitrate binding protein FerR (Iron transport regulator) n=1 Tax=Chitinophaga dinghuensis TaxID=1539050 RepID=A0A327VMN3_9BACT|nr:FecR family protein [Chitinophaga dinghuensis]RAJ76615.1 ferric-dicitrate binding protein FerR (iron transport regulator) [Chitinophaga dinghuensis]